MCCKCMWFEITTCILQTIHYSCFYAHVYYVHVHVLLYHIMMGVLFTFIMTIICRHLLLILSYIRLMTLYIIYQDGINTYTCSCAVGLTGTHCETDIDDCMPTPCLRGSCEVCNLIHDIVSFKGARSSRGRELCSGCYGGGSG